MKKTALVITLLLPASTLAQESEPSSPGRNEIEGLYLGMPKAAAEDEIAKFCLKNEGRYKTEEIKGKYGVIFADITGCDIRRDEYLYVRTAQDTVYDISKSQYINVEGNYENSELLLERAKSVYGQPTLLLDRKDKDNSLTWEITYQNLSQIPEAFRKDIMSYTRYNNANTVACWGEYTSTRVNNDVYVRSGDKAIALVLGNGNKLRLFQRMVDFEAIDTAWQVYQDAENEQINAEKAANKSIIDSVSF